MLLNLSNHPSAIWDEPQLAAAAQYGEIADMSFPAIDAAAYEAEIEKCVNMYFEKIRQNYKPQSTTVHIMGELTFCFALIARLQAAGFTCIASTSERNVVELDINQKQVNFKFVRFRKYEKL
jgi:hypothetical protein